MTKKNEEVKIKNEDFCEALKRLIDEMDKGRTRFY